MYKFEERKLLNLIDEELLEVFTEEKCIIAGGAITSLFTRGEINDIDVYFRSKESLVRSLEYILDNAAIHAFTDKATLFTRHQSEVPIQFIHFKYFKDAKEIFDTFDFTVCMGAYDFGAEEFIFDERFFKHNSQRMLNFNHNTAYPIVSALRLQKYENKGYTISKPEFLKIMLTINNLNINSYKQVKEQLGGMYGVSYDKLYEDIKDDDKFDMLKVIERLGKILLDDEYFKSNSSYNEHEDSIKKFINTSYISEDYKLYEKNFKYIVMNRNNEVIKIIDDSDLDIEEDKLTNGNPSMYVYKNVEKCEDGTLKSFYDGNFIYKIGEQIEAKNRVGLFFSENISNVNNAWGSSNKNRVVLKCLVKLDDMVGNFEFNKCIPLEIIHINKI